MSAGLNLFFWPHPGGLEEAPRCSRTPMESIDIILRRRFFL